jgi:two-component system OmpR family sensor kinase
VRRLLRRLLRRPTRPRTLRARLLVALVALLATVSAVIGLVSVVALDRFLLGRLDDQLTFAVTRSKTAFNRPPANAYFPDRPPAGNGVLKRPQGRPDPPPFLYAPGQAEGTLGMSVDRGTGKVQAGILDSSGESQDLTAQQQAVLRAVPIDERPHSVDLGGIAGDYRVVALRSAKGDLIVTGLPLRGVHATVYRLAGVAAGVGLAGLLLAAFLGAAIMTRALRPLERVAATATRVTRRPLDRGEVSLADRVPGADTDPRTEVGQVGAALNRLLGHVAGALAVRHASEARVRRFVADASHELRTPLASIRGYAELTRRSGTEVPPDVAHALRRIESESLRMTDLVEDLLLLARLDDVGVGGGETSTGRPLELEPVDLSALLVDAVSDAHAAGPGHLWRLRLPDDAAIVDGDAARLHQVVANLLGNARVHTPPGTDVLVELWLAGRTAIVEIADSGPGIPASLLPEVFERFARGDGSRSRAAGSTGLGLSIVSAVVTAHGGEVTVTSRPGRTSFRVTLPLCAADPAEPAEPEAPGAVAAGEPDLDAAPRPAPGALTNL